MTDRLFFYRPDRNPWRLVPYLQPEYSGMYGGLMSYSGTSRRYASR